MRNGRLKTFSSKLIKKKKKKYIFLNLIKEKSTEKREDLGETENGGLKNTETCQKQEMFMTGEITVALGRE